VDGDVDSVGQVAAGAVKASAAAFKLITAVGSCANSLGSSIKLSSI